VNTVFLVTGANGFLGKAILRCLLDLGYPTKIIVRDMTFAINHPNNHLINHIFVTPDFFGESTSWMKSTLEGVDVVIHTAWYAEPGKYLHSELNIKCFEGTVRFAKACIFSQVKQFIGIGTCFEYDLKQKIFSIRSKLNPKSLYAESKVATFYMLKNLLADGGVNFLWCRLFYLFGQGESEIRLAAHLHKNLSNNQNVELSDGDQIRDFIDVDVAANKIVHLAIEKNSGVRNICSGHPISIRKFCIKIADGYGHRDLLKFGLRPRNSLDPDCVVGISESTIIAIGCRRIMLSLLVLIEKIELFFLRRKI